MFSVISLALSFTSVVVDHVGHAESLFTRQAAPTLVTTVLGTLGEVLSRLQERPPLETFYWCREEAGSRHALAVI